ncbi:MAG: hypothetical protein ACOYZ7_09445 [Chloroflexota bacterium]
MTLNHRLGYGMIALAVPAVLALVALGRAGILAPYLVLFFGAILLMWLVTVATTVFLLASMGAAMRKGVA